MKIIKCKGDLLKVNNQFIWSSSCSQWNFTDPLKTIREKCVMKICVPKNKAQGEAFTLESLSNKCLISWQAAKTECLCLSLRCLCLSLSWAPAKLVNNLPSIRILEIRNKPVWLPRHFPEKRCLSNTIKTVWTILHREANKKGKGVGWGLYYTWWILM